MARNVRPLRNKDRAKKITNASSGGDPLDENLFNGHKKSVVLFVWLGFAGCQPEDSDGGTMVRPLLITLALPIIRHITRKLPHFFKPRIHKKYSVACHHSPPQ